MQDRGTAPDLEPRHISETISRIRSQPLCVIRVIKSNKGLLTFNRLFICPGFFKSLLHLSYTYPWRIVIDRVDFPGASPAACYLLDTVSPFQGSFSYIVSTHTENGLCVIGQDALASDNSEDNKQGGKKSKFTELYTHRDLHFILATLLFIAEKVHKSITKVWNWTRVRGVYTFYKRPAHQKALCAPTFWLQFYRLLF